MASLHIINYTVAFVFAVIKGVETTNPLSPKSDQHQISPYSINT